MKYEWFITGHTLRHTDSKQYNENIAYQEMIRKILFCLMLAAGVLGLRAADGDWKLHMSLDADYKQIFDAPDRVYIVAYGQMYNPNDKYYQIPKVQLFVHDKSTGETLGYSSRNYLSSPMVHAAQYNARDGYLCVVYTDGNMDLIYDNDRIVNIPALMNATLTESKTVNSITFGLDDRQIYLATDFGFVAIDPASGQIVKARNYHEKMVAIARVGGKLVLSDGKCYYVQDYDKPLQTLGDFNKIQHSQSASIMLPLTDNRMLVSQSWSTSVLEVTADNDVNGVSLIMNDMHPTYYSANKDGYLLSGTWAIISVSYDGKSVKSGGYPSDSYHTRPVASADYRTYYIPDGRKGVAVFSKSEIDWEASTWIPKGHLSRPNASAVFMANFMAYSDKYGMLVINPSHSRLFESMQAPPTLLSGLKNGEWTIYSHAYTHPEYADVHTLAKGIAVDPNNPDIIYMGSRNEGLQIFNLANPEDVVNLAAEGSKASEFPGFVQVRELSTSGTSYFNIAEPHFDASGNLWVYHPNDYDKGGQGDLWVWPAASLRSKNYTAFHTLHSGAVAGVFGTAIPLRAASNRNMVLVSNNNYGDGLALIDHNGTLDNPADDRKILLRNLTNQDGGAITYEYAWSLYEDEETGTVWIGTNNGIFTIQPWKVFDNPVGRRIKVSRNDGTNLADYLLDGADVRYITADGSGNKWFATLGAGVVQTSADGTHVMRQLTMDNSYLPSDNTFNLCYNPANNSMMIATMDGLAEYFVPGASSGDNFDQVKIYPNPVRPDFVGYITIEGLLDNSLVKIVDSEGNIVKELGSPFNGLVRWDGTNITGAKVNSGVYFVFMSRSGEGAGEANVGKVLVVK